MGTIKLSSGAMKETNKQHPNLSREVINLSKNIRNAKYISIEEPIHTHPKYEITNFHRLRGENVDYLISENKKKD